MSDQGLPGSGAVKVAGADIPAQEDASDVTVGVETAARADSSGADAQEGVFASACFKDLERGNPAVQVWITLVGREGCHLCDEALLEIGTVVERLQRSSIVTKMLGRVDKWLRVLQRSIDDHQDLKAKFEQEIPVVFINGRQNSYWRVNRERLFADILGAMKAKKLLNEIRLELAKTKGQSENRKPVPRSKPLKRRKRI